MLLDMPSHARGSRRFPVAMQVSPVITLRSWTSNGYSRAVPQPITAEGTGSAAPRPPCGARGEGTRPTPSVPARRKMLVLAEMRALRRVRYLRRRSSPAGMVGTLIIWFPVRTLMMKRRIAVFAIPLLIGFAGCSDDPVQPEPDAGATLAEQAVAEAQAALVSAQQQQRRGSGLQLESVTGIRLPLIGRLGDVVVDEAVITNFDIVEGVAGTIIGLQAEGVLELSGGALGTDLVTEEFRTDVTITRSGPGRCRVIGVDLGPIDVDALGEAVSVDVPEASVTTRSAGLAGLLLCLAGRLLETTITDPIANALRFVVDVINFLLI
jgi:hypothetical protein